jgi:hypothetical protein
LRALALGVLVCLVVVVSAAVVLKIRFAPASGSSAAPQAAPNSKERSVAAQLPAPAIERVPEPFAPSSEAGSEVWSAADEALEPVRPVPDHRPKIPSVTAPPIPRPHPPPHAKSPSIDDLLEGRQ